MKFSAAWVLAAQLCVCCAETLTSPAGCASRPCVYTITCAAATCTAAESAQVQRALDEAQPGDTVKLEAGRTFRTPGWWLPSKDGTESWITVTTTRDADLPAEDTRITPAYAPLLPKIVAIAPPLGAINTENGPLPRPAERYKLVGLMFTNDPGRQVSRGHVVIGLAGSSTRPVEIDPAADTVKTAAAHGLSDGEYVQFTTTGTLPEGLQADTRYYLINSTATAFRVALKRGGPPVDITGPGSGTQTLIDQGVTRPEHQARYIVIDRCYFTATPFDNVRRPLGIHGSHITVRNSFVERAKDVNTDAQAILFYNGIGPYTIENNFLEASTENVMFGGGIGSLIANPPLDENGVTPADILIRFNYMPKNPARYRLERWRSGMYVEAGKPVRPTGAGNVSYVAVNSGMTGAVEPAWPQTLNETVSDGEVTWRAWSPNGVLRWVVKNNFELKTGERATIQHNVFENMWRDGQETAINFKTENQARPNGEYVARTENILFRDNIVRSAPAAWKGSQGVRGKAANWHIVNNLFTDIDARAYGDGTERQLQIANLPFPGFVFEHNTIISPNSAATMILDRLGVPDEPIIFRNNILQRGTLEGIKGSGRGEGSGTFEFYMCGGKACPPGAVSPNIIAGVNRRVYPEGTFNLCPTDAACKPDLSALGFTDPANGDFSLADSSPFKTAAGDGAGLGVDMTQLPQIRNLRVEPGSTKAVLYYRLSQPIQHIPCVVEVSRKRDFSDPVPDVNPALFQRADSDRRATAVTDGPWHSFVIGADVSEAGMDGNIYSRALEPATEYHYRLMCGGDTRTGTFVTAGGTGRSSIGYTVIVPPGENAVAAAVEYGAVEDGGPAQFRRRTDPVDCASGCEIPVEAQTDSVLYFRVVYKDAAGQEIPAAVQAVVIP